MNWSLIAIVTFLLHQIRTRSHFTNGFNKTLQSLDCFINLNLNFISHRDMVLFQRYGNGRFAICFNIGHNKIKSTLIYAKHLSEEEREKRFIEIIEN